MSIPEQFTTVPNDRPAPLWEKPGLYWNPAYLRYIAKRDKHQQRVQHGAVRVEQAPPTPINPFRARKERGVA